MVPVVAGLLHVMLPENLRGPLSGLGPHDREVRLLVMIPFLCAGATYLLATFSLMRGIKRDIWNEAELADVRRWIEHPIWIGVIALSFLSVCVAFIWYHPAGSTIMLMVPGQAVLQLKNMFKMKIVEQHGILGL